MGRGLMRKEGKKLLRKKKKKTDKKLRGEEE